MRLARMTAPDARPVSLTEVKDHLAVAHDMDDEMLERLIDSAVAALDGWNGRLGRAMIAQNWRLIVGRFPHGALPVPMCPVLSIEAVGHVDADGADVVADPANFRSADLRTLDGARVFPAAGKSWPSLPSGHHGGFVEFRAGYGETPEDVPADLRHAIMASVGTAYTARESVSFLQVRLTPVEEIESAIDRHRAWRFG